LIEVGFVRILVVDDVELNRMVLQQLLKPFGESDFGVNGIQAIQKFNRALEQGNPYDLVCLDIMMPEMDGTKTVQAMRKIEETRKIPEENKATILMVTAVPSKEHLLKTYKYCQGFLIKPITGEKLYAKLEEIGITTDKDLSDIDYPGKSRRKTRERKKREQEEPVPKTKKKREKKEDEEEVADQSLISTLPFILLREDRAMVAKKQEPTENEPDPVPLLVHISEYAPFKSVKAKTPFARIEKKDSGVEAGNGVKLKARNNVLYAERGGKISFADGKVFLEEDFILKGRLMEDIDFAGRVKIDGDVIDGVKIKGLSGIEITGKTESCVLESDGDISVSRVDGRGSTYIKAGGNFTADFLYEANVECHKKAVVAKESVNSSVKSLEGLEIGSFVGGECLDLASVEIRRAGSPKDVSSLIRVGRDFTHENMIANINDRIAEVEGQIREYEGILGAYAEKPMDALSLPEAKQIRIFDLAGKRNFAKYSDLLQLKEELDDIEEQDHEAAKHAKLVVSDNLFIGVTIEIGAAKQFISETRKGKTVISESSDDENKLVFSS
jgi:two-component system chemotaxis response regulator CheY